MELTIVFIKMGGNLENEETRQEHREKRKLKKQEKMLKHGKGLARVYKDAILKRLKQLRHKE